MTSAQRRLLANLVAWYDDPKTNPGPSFSDRVKGATLSPAPTADCLQRLGFVEIVGVAFPFRARYAPTATGRAALQDGGSP